MILHPFGVSLVPLYPLFTNAPNGPCSSHVEHFEQQDASLWGRENGNKLIVFNEDRYAIFDTYEVFILCGTNVRKPTGVPETISKEDILLKYGALLE